MVRNAGVCISSQNVTSGLTDIGVDTSIVWMRISYS